MKKIFIVGIVLAYSLCVSGITFAAASVDSDVQVDHWAYPAIKALIKDGIIEGYPDGTFRGDKPISRYEMAKIVDKAIENSSKANAHEKALIDKLAAEFALELNNIDLRVQKVEDAQKNAMKLGFDTLLVFSGDSPPADKPKEQGNQQFRARWRLFLNDQVNQNTTFDARLATSTGDFGMGRTSTSNPMIGFDRVYFTTKKFLGYFDSAIWGRQRLDEIGGNIIYQSGNNDGITLIKNLSSATTLKVSALVIKPEPTTGVVGDTQELQFVSLTSKVAPNLQFYGTLVNNNTSMATSQNNFNYSYNSSKIAGIGAAYKMGRWTLMSEYDRANLQNPVNVSSNPYGYAFQLTDGTVAPDQFGYVSTTHCDMNKVGDRAFTIAYRNNQPGLAPGNLGNWNGGMMVSSKYLVNGLTPSAVDGVKGWMVDYQYVIDKGIQLSLDYQHMQYSKTGALLDNTYYFMVALVF